MIQQQINRKIVITLIKIIANIIVDEDKRNKAIDLLKSYLGDGISYLTPILDNLEKILDESMKYFLIELMGDVMLNSHPYTKTKKEEFSTLEQYQRETIVFVQSRPNLECVLIRKGSLKINLPKRTNMVSNLKI